MSGPREMALNFGEYPHGGVDYAAAVALRRAELRIPLGLDFSDADLVAESAERHFAAWEDGRLVATLSVRPVSPTEWKIRQVAVLAARQRRGLGRLLVDFMERVALREGVREIVLHAREAVLGFYEQLGYLVEGEPFIEVTIPHRRMRKRLGESGT